MEIETHSKPSKNYDVLFENHMKRTDSMARAGTKPLHRESVVEPDLLVVDG